ncbi:hypothetical protein K3495_g2094 [Podosphaera aphanis]|nr:hypothetical protein K3495_g2094 [Podosphaera aphanis]
MSFNLSHNHITSSMGSSSRGAVNSQVPLFLQRHYSVAADDNLSPLSYSDEEIENAPPLIMTSSHAQNLNAELDALDAEIMGDENMKSLRANSSYPNEYDDMEYRYYEDNVYESEIYSDLDELEVDAQPTGYDGRYFQNLAQASYQQNQQHNIYTEYNSPLIHTMNQSQSPWVIHQYATSGLPEENQSFDSINFGLVPPLDYIPQVDSLINSQAAPIDLNPISNTWLTEGAVTPSVGATPEPYQAAQLNPSSPLLPGTNDFGANNENSASENLTANHENFAGEILTANHEMEEQINLDLYGTLRHWSDEVSYFDPRRTKGTRGPSLYAVEALRSVKPNCIQRSDLRGDECDMQRINWKELGISRLEARRRRSQIYCNYTNIRYPEPLYNSENYFRFRRMDFNHEIHMLHFQLRNLIASPTRDHVFYGGRSKILHHTPAHGEKGEEPTTVLDLSCPVRPSRYSMTRGVQITTMAIGHDALIAGGFHGEYGIVNLLAQKGTKHTEGLISEKQNSIINHIQIYSPRGNNLPVAAFSSNNNSLRLLDIATNTVTTEHSYDHPINCSAISPDHRLRVMVGDMQEVLICNAETGAQLQSLEGHHDFGFACDWADDGWTVATGNQDKQIKIWDARKWTTSRGEACPISTVVTEMAGVRKLKFSPLGSGKRILVAAEPVDYISVIDAEKFLSKQTLSFFGEISGFDFTNDGQDLFVANSDKTRGGIMEFERSNLAGYGRYDLENVPRTRNVPETYDWMTERDIFRHPKSNATLESLERRVACLGVAMGHF